MKTELLDQIKEDLIKHEGYVREIYYCPEGYPTFGVGHMITEVDPEYTWPVGTPVEDERILQVFHEDCMVAIDDSEVLIGNLYDHPDNVIRVIVNMAFNLGRNRLSGFKKMIAAVDAKDYHTAGNEMVDSKWYGQVGRRSADLVRLMKGLS